MAYEKEYGWAVEAAKQIGWLPQVIFAQWVHETGWFKSTNYIMNKNIAGQTWYQGCGYPVGTKRPIREGGNYIKYNDPVTGYVSFVLNNQRRYGNVKNFKTVEEQVKAIKAGGWAVDPNYVTKVMGVYRSCLDKGIFNRPVVKQPVKTVSLVDYLKALNRPSDFESRRKLAYQYGVVSDPRNYSGTAAQNSSLLSKLQG